MSTATITRTKPKGSKMTTPKISSEFRAFMPTLTDEEYGQLERNVLKDGIREPITIWKGHDIVVDGMNRLELARKHDLKYEMSFMDFADKEEAFDWMASNQTGRRNLTREQRAYFLGREYRKTVGSAGGDFISEEGKEKGVVVEQLAEKHNVSASTVAKADRYAAAVDRISSFNPEARQALLTGDGDSKPSMGDVSKFASEDVPDSVIKIVAAKLAQGKSLEEIKDRIPVITRPGKPKFDDRKIEGQIGVLSRAFAARTKAMGKSKESEACDSALEELTQAWAKWQERTT